MNKQSRKKIFAQNNFSGLNSNYQFKTAWGAVPHPQKAWKGGEDAIFTSKNVLVVADGVSGWAQYGIDAGIYSRRLISNISFLLQGQKELYFIQHPDKLALSAVQMTEEKGSSTLSILTLHPKSGVLRSFHVGDSIYGVFKKYGLDILGEEQQLAFDVPYQVYGGKLNTLHSNPQRNDQASDIYKGIYNQFNLAELGNSSIVLASDGLWDNIHTEQIRQVLAQQKDLIAKTKHLIQKTIHYCKLRQYNSPYYKKGLAHGLPLQKKGKVDDISIILAEIIQVII